jgi:hypothetical protein
MTIGMIIDLPGPMEMYDAVSAELTEQLSGGLPEGLVVHIARPTEDGVQLIEVWESQADVDRFNDEILAPIVERLSQGQAPPREQVMHPFEVHALQMGRGMRIPVPRAGAGTPDTAET